MNIRRIAMSITKWCSKNSTKILTGVAVVSNAMGYYFMHKEAPIVKERLAELDDNAKWYEKVKVAGPVYLPAIGMFLLSSGCSIGGCAIGNKRLSDATALYSVTSAALRRTEEKLVEVVGDKKAQDVHKAVAEDILKANPVKAHDVELTGKGDVLFFEPLTGRYFRSSLDAVKNANVDFKDYTIRKIWGSVNEWYDFLGLRPAKLGKFVGWNVDHNIDAWFDEGHTDDKELCWVIRHINEPILGSGENPVDIETFDETL